jgi:hypothetical protein
LSSVSVCIQFALVPLAVLASEVVVAVLEKTAVAAVNPAAATAAAVTTYSTS